MPTSKKRVNKTKTEIAKQMEQQALVVKQRALAKIIFDKVSTLDTIYDAQTATGALSGYIKYELAVKEMGLKINDLLIDLKNEPKTKITDVIDALKVELQNQPAKETAQLLERFSNTLAQFSAAQYLKNPMSSIKVEDIIA